MAVTLRFQSSGMVPGDGQPIVMRGPSLTIGRGQENDVVLPDPDRMISKTHCALENHNGNVVVVDFSTNGTFLNYGKVALGRTATPINDGDVLIMGAYELVVQITSANPSYADPLAPLAAERASFGNAAAAPDPYKLLDDAAPGGDFLDGLLGTAKPTGPKQFRKQQEDFVELLPPLGDEGPLLGPAPELPTGPAMRDHSASVTDSFLPAGRAAPSKSLIPDDWDDLMAPTPKARPVAPQAPLAPGQDIYSHSAPKPVLPEDDIFGGPPPPASPEDGPASVATPPAPSEDLSVAAVAAAAPFDPFATDLTKASRSARPPAASADLPAPRATPAGSDPARAFLAAAGAEDLMITDAELPETMTRLGQTLKSMIVGLREILMTRTSIKSEFRIEQTMVNVGGNNPLKFSVSPEQAVEAMVKPTARGYLPAHEAATQALEDIKAHEIAMVTGMEAALKGVLAKLNPASLTAQIEKKGGFGGFLSNRKAKYWETYEAMYAEISDQAQNDFHELFAREFAQAYRKQLARLKDAKTQGKG
jgi:type VI secretion system protein